MGKVYPRLATEISDLTTILKENAIKNTTAKPIFLNANLFFKQRGVIGEEFQYDPRGLDQSVVELNTHGYLKTYFHKEWMTTTTQQDNNIIIRCSIWMLD